MSVAYIDQLEVDLLNGKISVEEYKEIVWTIGGDDE